MKRDAQYNTETKKGTYTHRIHHSEVVPGTKFKNDAPNAYGQNLAADKGTSGAMKSLRSRLNPSK